MTINEILKAKGIDDKSIEEILADMKVNKIFTASEENLDIRFGKLKTQHDGVAKQLEEANTLIDELKKSNKGNEDLQGKITAYETQVTQLQEELKQAKIDAAIKVGLLSSKALDVDYLTFKLKEKGELELDEDDKIKGWDDKLAALKTQCPTQFENAKGDGNGYQVFNPNRINKDGGSEHTPTVEEFKNMTYEQRVKLKQENEELYKQLRK